MKNRASVRHDRLGRDRGKKNPVLNTSRAELATLKSVPGSCKGLMRRAVSGGTLLASEFSRNLKVYL